MLDDVSVTLATDAEKPLIVGLIQFYIYDFSDLEPANSERFEPGSDGRFTDYLDVERYWEDPKCAALLIRRGDRAVGFALLNTLSHSGGAIDRNMGEFFVMRKHRRGGVASAAARAIFRLYGGRWEVAIAERNQGAAIFWPRAIAATPGVTGLTTLQGDGIRWTGPILSFTTEAGNDGAPSEQTFNR